MNYQPLFNVVSGLLMTVSLALSGWALSRVVLYGEALATIQGSRFTSGDGLVVWQKISDLQNQISVNSERVLSLQKRMDRADELRHGSKGELTDPLGG